MTAKKLRTSWRIGIVAVTALAVALPGVDPVTTLIELGPLSSCTSSRSLSPQSSKGAGGRRPDPLEVSAGETG